MEEVDAIALLLRSAAKDTTNHDTASQSFINFVVNSSFS
jgi:hypothetical protein